MINLIYKILSSVTAIALGIFTSSVVLVNIYPFDEDLFDDNWIFAIISILSVLAYLFALILNVSINLIFHTEVIKCLFEKFYIKFLFTTFFSIINVIAIYEISELIFGTNDVKMITLIATILLISEIVFLGTSSFFRRWSN